MVITFTVCGKKYTTHSFTTASLHITLIIFEIINKNRGLKSYKKMTAEPVDATSGAKTDT